MKVQWSLIFALIFALLVAIFAVANVGPVPVNYVFGVSELPLILVILGSALVGGLIVGLFGIIRQYRMQRRIKQQDKQLAELQQTMDEFQLIEQEATDTVNLQLPEDEAITSEGESNTDANSEPSTPHHPDKTNPS